MQLAPADFQAWAQATGNPYPATPQERAQVAQQVIAWKAQNAANLAADRGPNALGGLLVGAGALGLGASGVATWQYFKNRKRQEDQPAPTSNNPQVDPAATAAPRPTAAPPPPADPPAAPLAAPAAASPQQATAARTQAAAPPNYIATPGLTDDLVRISPRGGPDLRGNLDPTIPYLDGSGLAVKGSSFLHDAFYGRTGGRSMHKGLAFDPRIADPVSGEVTLASIDHFIAQIAAEQGDSQDYRALKQFRDEMLTRNIPGSDARLLLERTIDPIPTGVTRAKRGKRNAENYRQASQRPNLDKIKPKTPPHWLSPVLNADSTPSAFDYGASQASKQAVIRLPDGSLRANQYIPRPDGTVINPLSPDERKLAEAGQASTVLLNQLVRLPNGNVVLEEHLDPAIHNKLSASGKLYRLSPKEEAIHVAVAIKKDKANLIKSGKLEPNQQRVDPREHSLFFEDSDGAYRPYLGGTRILEDGPGSSPLIVGSRTDANGATHPVFYTGRKLDGSPIADKDLLHVPTNSVQHYGYRLRKLTPNQLETFKLQYARNSAFVGDAFYATANLLDSNNLNEGPFRLPYDLKGRTISKPVLVPGTSFVVEPMPGIAPSAHPALSILEVAQNELGRTVEPRVTATDLTLSEEMVETIPGRLSGAAFANPGSSVQEQTFSERALAAANAFLDARKRNYEALAAAEAEKAAAAQAEMAAAAAKAAAEAGLPPPPPIEVKTTPLDKRIEAAWKQKQQYQLAKQDAELRTLIATQYGVEPNLMQQAVYHLAQKRSGIQPRDRLAATSEKLHAEAVMDAAGNTGAETYSVYGTVGDPFTGQKGELVQLVEDSLVEPSRRGGLPRMAAEEWLLAHAAYRQSRIQERDSLFKNGIISNPKEYTINMPTALSQEKAQEIASKYGVTLAQMDAERRAMRREHLNRSNRLQPDPKTQKEKAARIHAFGLYAIGDKPLEKVFNSLGVHASLGQLATYKLLGEGKVQAVNNSLASIAPRYEAAFKPLLQGFDQSERINIISEGIASSIYDLDRFLKAHPDAAVKIGSGIQDNNINLDAYVKSFLRDYVTMRGIVDDPSGIPKFQVPADAVEELAFDARNDSDLSTGIKNATDRFVASSDSPLAAVRRLNRLTTEAHDNDPNGIADRLAKAVIDFPDPGSASTHLLASSPPEIQFSYASRLVNYEPATAGFWDRNPSVPLSRERIDEINAVRIVQAGKRQRRATLPKTPNARWNAQISALDTKSPNFSADKQEIEEKINWAQNNTSEIAAAVGDLNRGLSTDQVITQDHLVSRLPLGTPLDVAQRIAAQRGLKLGAMPAEQAGQQVTQHALFTQVKSAGRGHSVAFVPGDPNSATAKRRVGVTANVEGRAMALPDQNDDDAGPALDRLQDWRREDSLVVGGSGVDRYGNSFDGFSDEDRADAEFVKAEVASVDSLAAPEQFSTDKSELQLLVENTRSEAAAAGLPEAEVNRRVQQAIAVAGNISQQQQADRARGAIKFKSLGSGQSDPQANAAITGYLFDLARAKLDLAETSWTGPYGLAHRVHTPPADRQRMAANNPRRTAGAFDAIPDYGALPLAAGPYSAPAASAEPVRGAPLHLPSNAPPRAMPATSTSYSIGRSSPGPDRTFAARLRQQPQPTATPDGNTLDALGFTQQASSKAAFLDGFIAARQGINDDAPRTLDTLPAGRSAAVQKPTALLSHEQQVAYAGYVGDFWDKMFQHGVTQNLKPKAPASSLPNQGKFVEPSLATLNARVNGLRRRGIL